MKCGSDTIAGTIERVTFHNPENGLTVVKTAIEGHRDLHSYGVGTARAVHIDERYEGDAIGTPFTLIC